MSAAAPEEQGVCTAGARVGAHELGPEETWFRVEERQCMAEERQRVGNCQWPSKLGCGSGGGRDVVGQECPEIIRRHDSRSEPGARRINWTIKVGPSDKDVTKNIFPSSFRLRY
jgi:hypothetical protein